MNENWQYLGFYLSTFKNLNFSSYVGNMFCSFRKLSVLSFMASGPLYKHGGSSLSKLLRWQVQKNSTHPGTR